jgi:hypothetical protein
VSVRCNFSLTHSLTLLSNVMIGPLIQVFPCLLCTSTRISSSRSASIGRSWFSRLSFIFTMGLNLSLSSSIPRPPFPDPSTHKLYEASSSSYCVQIAFLISSSVLMICPVTWNLSLTWGISMWQFTVIVSSSSSVFSFLVNCIFRLPPLHGPLLPSVRCGPRRLGPGFAWILSRRTRFPVPLPL